MKKLQGLFPMMVVLLAGMLLSLTGCGEHGHSVVGPEVQQSATPAPDSVGGIDRPGVGPEKGWPATLELR